MLIIAEKRRSGGTRRVGVGGSREKFIASSFGSAAEEEGEKKRERTKRRIARSPSSPTLLLLHRCLIIDTRARARKRKRRPSDGARRRFVTATEPKERFAFPPARSATPLSLPSCASPRRMSGRAAPRRALHCPLPLPSQHVCAIPIPLLYSFQRE